MNHIEKFNDIRLKVKSELQKEALAYISNIRKYVIDNLTYSINSNQLSAQYANHLLEHFRITNDDKIITSSQSIVLLLLDRLTVKFEYDFIDGLQNVKIDEIHCSSLENVKNAQHILKKIEHILEFDFDVMSKYYNSYKNSIAMRSAQYKSLLESHALMQKRVLKRVCTAYDFQIGVSMYTVNIDFQNPSLLYWDRYTIINETTKSYYIEQWCIVEDVLTGTIYPDKFIVLHKPSKNSIDQFLSQRCACIDSLQRPIPNVDYDFFTRQKVVLTDAQSTK